MTWWRCSDTQIFNLNTYSYINFHENVNPDYPIYRINFYVKDTRSFSIQFLQKEYYEYIKAKREILELLSSSK